MPYAEDLRADLRPEVVHRPLQLTGTGVVVWKSEISKEALEPHFLLQLRTDFNKFGLFGGGIEPAETYPQCAVRELLEESGLRAQENDLEFLNIYAGPDHVSIYPNGDVVYHTVVLYSVRYALVSVAGNPLSDETKQMKWLSISEIKSYLEENAEKYFFHNNIPIFRDVCNKFFYVRRLDNLARNLNK